MQNGNREQAEETVGKLRDLLADHEQVLLEISGIWDQLQRERGNLKSNLWTIALKELLLIKSNQKRVFVAVCEQILAQWSGANSITITFSPMVI